MRVENLLLENEKILKKFGLITLTTKRVIGEENVLGMIFGTMGNLITALIKSNPSYIQGTLVDISLGKIDSVELKIERKIFLLRLSNLLFYAAVVLLFFLLVWPYLSQALEPVVSVTTFILNLVTLGLAQSVFDLIGQIVSKLTSYELSILTFATSIFFFAMFILLKNVKVEVYSSNNVISTNLFGFFRTGEISDAQEFIKSVRRAEREFLAAKK